MRKLRLSKGLSEIDGLSKRQVGFVLACFEPLTDGDKEASGTTTLPDELGTATCRLYGPLMGDSPVGEGKAFLRVLPGRAWPSRLTRRPTRDTMTVSAVVAPAYTLEGGIPDLDDWVLVRAFAGPLMPPEPGHPSLERNPRLKAVSIEMWATHALAE